MNSERASGEWLLASTAQHSNANALDGNDDHVEFVRERHRQAAGFSRTSQLRVKLGMMRPPISEISSTTTAMPIWIPTSAAP